MLVRLRLILSKGRCHRAPTESGDNYNERNGVAKPLPPSHRYHHYDHATEEQHRTAEQFSWRDGYRLNVGIAIAAVVAAGFAAGSFHETKRQADIAHDTLIVQNRPWLKINFVRGDLHWNDPNSFLASLSLSQSNIGGGPAITYDVAGDITGPGSQPSRTSHVLAIKAFCKETEPSIEDTRSVLFKDTSKTNDVIINKTFDEAVASGIRKSVPQQVGEFDLTDVYAIACVSYKVPGDDVWRHTGVYAHLNVWDGKSNKAIPNFARVQTNVMVAVIVDDYAD